MNKISLFVPVYNEEEILEKNINKINDFVKNLYKQYEIFIVDDNSSDNTLNIAKKIIKKNKNIKYLRYNFGPTRRENLAQSFKKASGNIICFMDLDLSTDLNCLPKLINPIERGEDIAIGSRYIKGSKIKRTIKRKIISLIYNYFIRFYFKTKFSDYQCGFKAFKKKVILKLIDELDFDKTLKRGWFWDAELLIRAVKNNLRIVEIPIEWKEGKQSSLNLKREIKMIPYMLKFLKIYKQ